MPVAASVLRSMTPAPIFVVPTIAQPLAVMRRS
jgi:hypothetical protein